MSRQSKHLYDFGPFRLDADKRLLLKDGEPVILTRKAFDTLLAHVQDNDRVLDKEELMRRVWPDRRYRFASDISGMLNRGAEVVVKVRTRLRIVIEEEERLPLEPGRAAR
ncbi:MAG TPA: hypothetical protein VFQ92_20440 [Blastocatellia bacterium]|nr:hypothetical protein [Blastocatellia bacterium]